MIVIGGVPGTGKTSVAREISKIINKPITQLNVIKFNYSKKWNSLIVEPIKTEGYIIEGHLTCEVQLNDTIFILRTNPFELERRLKNRKYSQMKIWENMMAEALDYCPIKAEKYYNTIFEIDTTDIDPISVANKIVNKQCSKTHISWKKELEEMIKYDMQFM